MINVHVTATNSNRRHTLIFTAEVVNDAAETNVKPHTDYSGVLTDDSEKHECIMQAAEKYQRDSPDFCKMTLLK